MQTTRRSILLIDDDPILGSILQANFNPDEFDLHLAETGRDGLDQAKSCHPELAILDVGLPDINGISVLEQLRAQQPKLPVVMLTGDTEPKTVVHAMQLGAFNYLTKPVDNEELLLVVQHAFEQRQQRAARRELTERRSPVSLMSTHMGSSPQVAELARQVGLVAESDFTVLVLGESGTGKELVAQAIHRQSMRARRPLVALDCGAIPEGLMESELFGHEKGAFTGADRARVGRIQLADGGTLLLDEIGNLTPTLQAKLLRVMESGEVTPVGNGTPQAVDVRFVAATNAELEERVKKGEFREDLYFRLAQYVIRMPPLRDRAEDIPYLAKRFVDEAALELRKPVTDVSSEALEVLAHHQWRGNVRELRNVIRLAVLQCTNFSVEAADVEPLLVESEGATDSATGKSTPELLNGASLKEITDAAVGIAECRAIRTALTETGGNKAKAARLLQTDYKTLLTKIKNYGLEAGDFKVH